MGEKVMANKQALPNGLLSANIGAIDSPAPNKVVAPEWKEQKWAIVAKVADSAVKMSAGYKDMKHMEMLAKLDNVQQQNLHALGDATDPCQLPELVKQANQSYDEMFKDDPYGKSFYESEAYKKFKTSNEFKVNQEVIKMNHKFDVIQATKTGNELSSDIALMSDPQRMSNALARFKATLDELNITPDERFKLMSSAVQDSFGKVFANNPNNAVAWYNASQGAYDQYGLNGADIKSKADTWNKAQLKEALTLQSKARTEKKAEEDAQIEYLTQQVRLGGKTKSQAQLEADTISARVGNEVYKNLEDKDNTKAEILKHNTELSKLIDVKNYEQSNADVNKYLLDNPNVPSESRAYINDVLANFKPEKGEQKRTLEQAQAIADQRTGLRNFTEDEMIEIANGDQSVYRDLREAQRQYNIDVGQKAKEDKAEQEKQAKEKKQETKEIREQEDSAFKELSKRTLAEKETTLYINSKNPKALAQAMAEPRDNMTAEDSLTYTRKIIDYVEKLDTEEKKQYETDKKQLQIEETNKILGDINKGILPTDDDLVKFAAFLDESQINQIRTARDKHLEEAGKQSVKVNNNKIIANTYRIWGEKKTVDVDHTVSQMQGLTADEEAKWRNALFEGNKRVATLVENQNVAKIQDAIWKSPTLPSDDTLREWARDVSKNGTTDEATLFDNFVQMRDEKAKDVNGKKTSAIEQLNTYWFAEGAYADTQKNKAIRAINEIIDNGKEPDVAKIITEYMPTPSQIRNSVLNESSATYEIENLQSKLFGYATTKIEEGDSQIKYSGWVASEDINFNDFRNYELLVENAMEKELITSDKYSEYVKPLMSGYEKAVNNALENPNSIIGKAATLLRNALYPETNELTLFDTEIKDYQDFYHHLSKVADQLEFYNVPLDATITKGERVLNSVRSMFGKGREYRGDFITTEIVVDEYIKSLFPNVKSGNKIVK